MVDSRSAQMASSAKEVTSIPIPRKAFYSQLSRSLNHLSFSCYASSYLGHVGVIFALWEAKRMSNHQYKSATDSVMFRNGRFQIRCLTGFGPNLGRQLCNCFESTVFSQVSPKSPQCCNGMRSQLCDASSELEATLAKIV